MKKIYYKDGYKHVLERTYVEQTDIFPEVDIKTEFIDLDAYGVLTIRHPFPWDGASGPTWDTPNAKRASAVHDALYWLMRMGYIPDAREKADKILYRLLLEDGMFKPRAWLWLKMVRLFAHRSSTAAGERKVKVAP